jgi:hypothetical protein
MVEFDVALTVAQDRQLKGGAGVEVFTFFKLGSEAQSEMQRSAVSRVQFSVPMILPTQKG